MVPANIIVTDHLFEAYLKCPIKCFLLYRSEAGTGNAYAAWIQRQNDSYRDAQIKAFANQLSPRECIADPLEARTLKTGKWRRAANGIIRIKNLESKFHGVEKCSSDKDGQPFQFIPVRFLSFNKTTKDDKMLLAFDALVLSEITGHQVSYGKIVHGDDHATLKVRVADLLNEALKMTNKIVALLSGDGPQECILNRHCIECEFHLRCRQIAIEKDDLSRLSGMSEKERKEFNSKGIFTVTHLSYTFRPRRKPKRFAGKSERYHHSLKALAIREGKVHVVGAGELKITGTPVYIDVEGLPDRDFYYLIGLRFGTSRSVDQHYLWADTQLYEQKIWHQFIDILSTIRDPVLVHYGSFEANFFRRMQERYGASSQVLKNPINLLSFIFARIYFPTYSNALKDIAEYLGFRWSEENPSGIKTIIWRSEWERSHEASLKEKLVTYNAEDCEALSRVTEYVKEISADEDRATENVILADSLPRESFLKFGKTHYLLPAFDEINRAAYWDYQREKIILRSDKRLKKITSVSHQKKSGRMKTNCVTHWPGPHACPRCGGSKLYQRERSTKQVVDIRFGRSSIERWVTTYIFHRYRCPACHAFFTNPDRPWAGEKYGRDLFSLCTYLNIELDLPQRKIGTFLREILGFRFLPNTVHTFKAKVASLYKPTYESLLQKIIGGRLIHADETKINLLHGGAGYVWVFASMEDVAYVYAPSREGQLAQTLLKDFKGVLVTDFYAAYDSIDCPHQKCLLHLIRDLNDELMKEPFNDELKGLVRTFAELLKPMIETVDRFGLRTRFLRKYKIEAEKFFNDLSHNVYRTESAEKCKKRFEKNRDGLFTFLDYDGVPWNNNNAEHAIKAVARLRENLGSLSTESAIEDYLIILSVSETCRFKGVNFLEFLRSGEKDIDAYIDSRIKRHTMRDQAHPAPMKARRRKFTTAYKLQIVKKLQNCPPGQFRVVLRQERLDSSCVKRWRRQVAQVLGPTGQSSQAPNPHASQGSDRSVEESQEQPE